MMTAVFRFFLIATAALTLLLAGLGLTGQNRAGGYLGFATQRDGPLWRVSSVQAGSNAYRAGLRVGDAADWSRLGPSEYLAMTMPVVGHSIAVPVVRGANIRRISFLQSASAPDELDRGWMGLVVVLGALAASLLVGFRKSESHDARFLAFFLAGCALNEALGWMWTIAATPVDAMVWSIAQLCVLNVWLTYGITVIATAFPPTSSRLRHALRTTAIALGCLAFLFGALYILHWITPDAPLADVSIDHQSALVFVTNLLENILTPMVAIVGCLTGLASVDDERRGQMNWVAFAIIVTQASWVFNGLAHVTALTWATPAFPWLQLFESVPLMIVLPYVILRHRLVDISVAVSRTAVFATVSALVVSAFVLGEWLIGKAADAWLPQNQKGIAAQAVILAVALVIGLSARSIHAAVERRLNALFFARRARSLANLRRFAHETDVVTKSPALLTMFYDAVLTNSDANYVALYLRDGATFVLARGSSPELPSGLDEDDAAVVHLRRWSEPYEYDPGTHPFSEALIVPMIVHGTLFGMLVCGPKRERTHYASEEIEALAQAAHRTGVAYVFLSHQSVIGGTPAFSLA
jgi:hypothetical protein